MLMLLAMLGAPALAICVPVVDCPPVIDGILDPAWSAAYSVSGLVQQGPRTGSAASESTTAYVLADGRNLYFALRCLARNASSLSRLNATNDTVSIRIDPFLDRTNCYVLEVTAAGSEVGLRFSDDGRTSTSWSAIWRTAARRYPWGYVVEIKLPFRSLRYPSRGSEWGIDFGRYDVANNEQSFWSSQEPYGYRVSRMGRMTLEAPGRDMHVEFKPALSEALNWRWGDGVGLESPGWGAGIDWFPRTSADAALKLGGSRLDAAYSDRFGYYTTSTEAELSGLPAHPKTTALTRARADLERPILRNSSVALNGEFVPGYGGSVGGEAVLRSDRVKAGFRYSGQLPYGSYSGSVSAGADFHDRSSAASIKVGSWNSAGSSSQSVDVAAGPEWYGAGMLDHAGISLGVSTSHSCDSDSEKWDWSSSFAATGAFRDRSQARLEVAVSPSHAAGSFGPGVQATLSGGTDPARVVSTTLYLGGSLNHYWFRYWLFDQYLNVVPGSHLSLQFGYRLTPDSTHIVTLPPHWLLAEAKWCFTPKLAVWLDGGFNHWAALPPWFGQSNDFDLEVGGSWEYVPRSTISVGARQFLTDVKGTPSSNMFKAFLAANYLLSF